MLGSWALRTIFLLPLLAGPSVVPPWPISRSTIVASTRTNGAGVASGVTQGMMGVMGTTVMTGPRDLRGPRARPALPVAQRDRQAAQGLPDL